MNLNSTEFERGPVFIGGNIKSGTTLLQSLLDGHQELFVIPIEIKFFKFANLPTMPPGNMPPGLENGRQVPLPRRGVDTDQIKKEIISHSDMSQMLEGKKISRQISIPERQLDRETFLETLDPTTETVRGTYVQILKAFHRAVNIDVPFKETHFVVKTPGLEEYAMELKKWFPSSTLIQSLRNPYANIYSIRKKSRYHRRVRRQYGYMSKSYYFLEKNSRVVNDYYPCKYEDVVLSTEKKMKQIAEVCSINSKSKTLTRPTILGKRWGGNSRTVENEFGSIDPRPVDAYKGKISHLDKFLVNKFFSNMMQKYGYKVQKVSLLKSLTPLMWEAPHIYLRNRMLCHENTPLGIN